MPGALPTKRLNILIKKKKKKNPQDAINIFSSDVEERTFCYSCSLKLHYLKIDICPNIQIM